MKHRISLTMAALLATTIGITPPAVSESGETKQVTVAGQQIAEIMPGMLEGFLTEEEQLDSKAFVLPAPAVDSARQAMDSAWAAQLQKTQEGARWDVAIDDADLAFPAAADRFSCALGIEVSEEGTPALYLLLRRTLTDIGLAPYSAKNAYQRERPFMVTETPVCTPQDEDALREDGSYPSGHTAIGWGWALLLTELAPDRAEEILARGRAFGESRNVCNAHWYSDVVAGRLVGSAAVARLHANEAFLEAMDAARADIERAREANLAPDSDCSIEASSLGIGN
ncbi:phosphatase PAP2 family protein [Tropicimonas sp. TH_r6]|uniref:acid phosphatase n=1 Tax=Tropicimonas sp. TH_r6 TaxID=3082085 RepID=UPI00295378C8|nr:phosphatase PAP2 family protein [Tropicimonas sp. TH_r6]MDV7145802.1 phosphatase PAP2 family protein [Tropicimonas sp. TH_r6]